MGLYEDILALAFIPVVLVVLALLANGTGRRKLSYIIVLVRNIKIEVGGYGFNLMTIMTVVNII